MQLNDQHRDYAVKCTLLMKMMNKVIILHSRTCADTVYFRMSHFNVLKVDLV